MEKNYEQLEGFARHLATAHARLRQFLEAKSPMLLAEYDRLVEREIQDTQDVHSSVEDDSTN